MTLRLDVRKFKPALILALFLMGQIAVFGHAIEFGTEPHEHNGIACLAVLTDEQECQLSPAQWVRLSLVPSEPESFPLPNQSEVTKQLAIRPPPTGPPSV